LAILRFTLIKQGQIRFELESQRDGFGLTLVEVPPQ
jgi:hypothetical protein